MLRMDNKSNANFIPLTCSSPTLEGESFFFQDKDIRGNLLWVKLPGIKLC